MPTSMKALAEIALRNGADPDDSRGELLPLEMREQMLEEALAADDIDESPRTVPYATGSCIPENVHEREYRLGRTGSEGSQVPMLDQTSGGVGRRDHREIRRPVRPASVIYPSSAPSLLTLKPYGNHLADGVVNSWVIFARLCIVSIALCDAVAWGSLARITASGPWAHVAAIVFGVMVFLVIGTLNATFVMQDVTSASVPSEQTHEEPRKLRRRLRALARVFDTSHVAMFVRVLLVMLAFIVTAPVLTMFVFSRDIDAAMAKQRAEAEAVARAALVRKYDDALADTQARLQQLNGTLAAELTGAGGSDRYGAGPTVRAIQEQIRRLESARDSLQAEKASQLRAFDAASHEERVAIFGVRFLGEGPEARARFLAELEKSQAFGDTRQSIIAFLGLTFLSLLILKLFQPRAVQHYYSESYQAAYADYRAGTYNARLSETLRPDQGGMTPAQFIRWYDQDQRRLEERETIEIRLAKAVKVLQLQQRASESLNAEFAPTLSRMQDDLDAVLTGGAELERRLKIAQARLHVVQSRIRELEDSRHEGALAEGNRLSEVRRESFTQLEADHLLEAELQAEISILTDRLETNARQRTLIGESMAGVGRQAAVISERMRLVQLEVLDEIASVG